MELFAPSPSDPSSEKRSPEGRPQTPYDFNLLKAAQPIQRHSPTPPPRLPQPEAGEDLSTAINMNEMSPKRDISTSDGGSSPPTLIPMTPPRQRSALRSSFSFNRHHANKRDSGFAHTADDKLRDSSNNTDSTVSSSSPPAVATSNVSSSSYKPSLPMIPPTSIPERSITAPRHNATRQSPSPTSQPRKLTKKRHSDRPVRTGAYIDSAKRLASFHGIEMDIPRGDFEDLRLADSVQFSKRGSVMLNKMAFTDGEIHGPDTVQPVQEEPVSDESSPAATPSTVPSPIPDIIAPSPVTSEAADRVSGLMPGKREQPARKRAERNSMRVLSAEENTFSFRVRSLYEQNDDHNPVPTIHEIAASKEDLAAVTDQSPQLDSSAPRPASVLIHQPIDPPPNTEVDRYGFLVPVKSASATEEQTVPIQRVSTTLQLVSQGPRPKRGVRRTLSSARSVRSRPSSSLGHAAARPESLRAESSDPSLHLNETQRPSRPRSRIFQRRASRLIEDASDMLTAPTGPDEAGSSQPQQQDVDSHETSLHRKRETKREEKWRKMATVTSRGSQGEGMTFDFDTRSDLLIRRTWKGIPDSWRASAWYSFLAASANRRGQTVTDRELVTSFRAYQDENCADDVQIDVDVPRTIVSHVMFRERYKSGQRLLFRVLHAISLHFPETGYVQGMASLAATLLCYYDEERAFVMLVRLWTLRGMETLFRPGFDGLMSALKIFETDWLVRKPNVAKKLKDLGIVNTSYGTRWYLTLFNMSMPFAAQLRVWDVYMLLGDAPLHTRGRVKSTKSGNLLEEDFGGADLDVLHAVSTALIDAVRDIVVESDFENSMKTLTSWIPVKDEDMLMNVAREEYRAKKKRKD